MSSEHSASLEPVAQGRLARTAQLFLAPDRRRMLLMSMFLGFGGASVFPVLSFYLGNGLGIAPFWIGLFYTCNTVAGVISSHYIAKASDSGLQRKKIMAVALAASTFGPLLMAQVTDYKLLLLVGMLWSGLSSSAYPQLFALAKEHIPEQDAPLFQSVLRAQMSLAWVVGPALAYLLYELVGFSKLMWLAAAMTALCFVWLPKLPDCRTHKGKATEPHRMTLALYALSLVIILMFSCNSSYIVYMPLYVTEGLGLGTMVPGILMGVAAGLEIPVMVGGGVLAQRWSLLRPLWVALLAGCGLYSGMLLATEFSSLLLLQLFNATMVGLAAGLGISVFQRLMPKHPGSAATLYSNSMRIGSMSGSAIGGVIAQWWGFRGIYGVNLLLMVLAMLLLLLVGRQLKSAASG